MQIDILSMLKFTLAAGGILLAGVWILYVWLKRTGRLNKVTRGE